MSPSGRLKTMYSSFVILRAEMKIQLRIYLNMTYSNVSLCKMPVADYFERLGPLYSNDWTITWT